MILKNIEHICLLVYIRNCVRTLLRVLNRKHETTLTLNLLKAAESARHFEAIESKVHTNSYFTVKFVCNTCRYMLPQFKF